MEIKIQASNEVEKEMEEVLNEAKNKGVSVEFVTETLVEIFADFIRVKKAYRTIERILEEESISAGGIAAIIGRMIDLLAEKTNEDPVEVAKKILNTVEVVNKTI